MKKKLGNIRFMRIAVTLVLFFGLLFAVVVFIAFREDITSGTMDSILSFFQWRDDAGESETFRFDPGANNLYEVVNDRLVMASPEQFSFYDKQGSEKYARPLSYDTPALCRAGNKVIVYDRTGTGCLIAGERSILLELDVPVLTADGNDRGQFVLVTEESGYRSVAGLYDKNNNLTYIWRSGRYIMAAGLSPLGTRMAVAAVGQDGNLAGTKITFLETGNVEPLAEVTLPDTLPLKIYYPDNSHVCIITESLVYFYTDAGELLGEYSWNDDMLLRFSASSEALFLQLGRYTGGQFSRVVTLGYEGTVLDTVNTENGLSALSAAGNFVSFLTPNGLTRYTITADGLQNPLTVVAGADGILQQENGNWLLLFNDHASLEDPRLLAEPSEAPS